MKILLVSPSIYPLSIGGMEIYNYYFSKELLALGENVSLLSNHSGKVPIDIRQYKIYTKNTFFRSLQIFFHLVFYNYDIIHITYASNSFLAYPFAVFRIFFKKNKYVIYIHGGGMRKWENEKVQRFFFKNAKEIISVSEPIKDEYERRVNRKIKTILPLIPFEKINKSREEIRKSHMIDESTKLLLSVGSIKPIKGNDFLIRCFIKLGKKYFIENNIKMVFIGDGILRNELEEEVKQNNLQGVISFLGRKPKEEIGNYKNAADIFIFASQFEGTPLAMLEAMYNELLVVGTNVSGIKNIIKDKVNGLLFEKDNYESFKNALEYALTHPGECRRMAHYAKNITMKDFDYKKNFLEHLKLYAE